MHELESQRVLVFHYGSDSICYICYNKNHLADQLKKQVLKKEFKNTFLPSLHLF